MANKEYMPLGNHQFVRLVAGNSPIILSVPHGGREMPTAYKKYIDEDAKQADLNTDLLAREIMERAEGRGYVVSMVQSLLQRKVLELNWWREETGGVKELEELYDAYYEALHELTGIAIDAHGFAIVIDVHGYDDSSRSVLGHSLPPSAVCFGTRQGRLVPYEIVPAFEAFRSYFAEAGYRVYPESGFRDEYGPFVGGSIVESFLGNHRVAAVQVETPRSVRIDDAIRNRYAGVFADALLVFAEAVRKSKGLGILHEEPENS